MVPQGSRSRTCSSPAQSWVRCITIGNGVPQDYMEAAKWLRKAADQELAQAQHDLGVMYADGHGVPQDYVEAHMWWNLAAAQGNDEAREKRDIVAKMLTRFSSCRCPVPGTRKNGKRFTMNEEEKFAEAL